MTEAKHTPTIAERLDWMLAQWEKPERKGVMLPGTQMTCDTAAEAVRAVIAEAKSSGPIAWESRPYEGREWRPTAESPSDETRRWMEHRRITGVAPELLQALRDVEWASDDALEDGGFAPACPCCGAHKAEGRHFDGCQVAAALSKAGLPQ